MTDKVLVDQYHCFLCVCVFACVCWWGFCGKFYNVDGMEHE